MQAGARRSREFDNGVVLACAMLGSFMQGIDTTVANVSLPYMQGALQASRDQITWVLTGYVVASAIMTAPVGWIAGRFGRKNFMVTCLAGFTVTSMLCGAAQTLDQIVLFRILQGMFGAALQPLSQAIVMDLYPDEKRGQVMAFWGIGSMLGPIIGPTLGGLLTEHMTWRWVFYINVPFGILATMGTWVYLHDNAHDRALKLDWIGFGVLSLGIGAMQLMLDRGQTQDWFSSGEIITETVLAGLGIYLFLVHMFTAEKPFIPKAMFADRNFVSAISLMFLVGMVVLASSALLPPYLQNMAGYTAVDTGLMMAPRGIGNVLGMLIVGRISNRVDPRLLIGFGMLLVLWSMWDMAHWTPQVSTFDVTLATVAQGFGLGFVFIPNNLVAFDTLPQYLRTDASAFFNLVRNIGSAIGISVTSALLANSMQIARSGLAANVSPFNRALDVNAQSLMWSPRLPFGLQSLNAIVDQNAAIIAYADDFLFMFFTCMPVLAVTLMMRPTRQAAPASMTEFIE